MRTLETEDKVLVSDRKLVKIYKLVRTRAFLFHGGAVDVPDLTLLGLRLTYLRNARSTSLVIGSTKSPDEVSGRTAR